MAIYHFSAKVISRSTGRSAVAAAAYRSASLLHDDQLGRDHDFTAKSGVVHSEIMLPADAPERWLDRATLWNEVEARERQRNSQLARDIEISLPRELSRPEAIALAQDFVREQFVGCGMVADLNVHWTVGTDGEAQPHAHVMLSMRKVVVGQGPVGHESEAGFGPKERDWNATALLVGWRARWAEMANQRLHELGHDARIDHRSYVEQGIKLEPQHKVGPAGARRAERGENAERRAEHDGIARRNGERIADDPTVALDALTRQHSTFTRQELARFVSRHTDGAEQFARVMAKVEASAELVRLGQDGRGRERFSTREMVAAEQRMEAAAATLDASGSHRVGVVEIDRAVRRAEAGGLALGDEQRRAVAHVTAGRDLALVVGYAGTGKSAMLGVARQAWEAEGYRVRGAALSGIAAEGLEGGSGIESRTLASLEWGWKEGRDQLTSRDVLVVDEAGMVGSRQMERVLSAAREAGAKVVLVGDPEQLQAIEAGAAFRALAERHGATEISAVRRQREEWQREATRELATTRTSAALARYEAAGMVRAHETQEAAREALVAGWAAARRDSPGQSQVMLAYTRADVAELNRLARERVRAAGELGADQVVQTERGERGMGAGDRLMFLRNERGLGTGPGGRGGVAVKNGTLGTVLAVGEGGERLTVRLDGAGGPAGAGQAGKGAAPVVTFSTRDYGHVDHGYAATIHKAQGVTVDRAHVLASRHMDRHAAYVALTRHRDGVALHWSTAELGDRVGLARTLGRERAKDVTLDYGGPEQAYAERRGLHPLRPESAIVVQRPETRTASGLAALPFSVMLAEAAETGRRESQEAGRPERPPALPPVPAVELPPPPLLPAWRDPLGWDRDSLDRGLDERYLFLAVEGDPAVRRERESLGNYLKGAYRDPSAAEQGLRDLVKAEGSEAAIQKLLEDPARLGVLRGRTGWLALGPVKQERENALRSVGAITGSLRRIDQAEQSARWDYVREVKAQQQRDATVIPGLSKAAQAVLGAVEAAASGERQSKGERYDAWQHRREAEVAAAWTGGRADPHVAAELDQFMAAAKQRLGEEGIRGALRAASGGAALTLPGVGREHRAGLAQVARHVRTISDGTTLSQARQRTVAQEAELAERQRGRAEKRRALGLAPETDRERERFQHRQGPRMGM